MKFPSFNLPVINWYKLGIYAVLFLAWTGGVYGYATHKCKMAHEQQKTEEAKQETQDTIDEVNERLPQVQYREVESAKQRAEIKRLEGALYEALKNRPANPSCDLSDAELDATNGLLRATHQK